MRRRVLLALVFLAGCGSKVTGDEAPTSPASATEAQRLDIQRLQEEAEVPFDVVLDAHLGAAVHIEGRTKKPVLQGKLPEAATFEFFQNHAALYRLADATQQLKVTKVVRDELAMTHVRLQQVVGELPVRGGEAIAHYDAEGALVTVDARTVPGLEGLDVTATLSPEAAVAAAVADMGKSDGRFDPAFMEGTPEAKLVVHAASKAPVYELTVRGGIEDQPVRTVYFVHAKTGVVVEKYDNIHTIQGSGTGVLGDTKTLEVGNANGGYALQDTLRSPNGIVTNTANRRQTLPGTSVTSTTATAWTSPAAVDAHAYAAGVYDFYKNVLGRSGIDGNNGAIVSTVNFGNAYNNAFWDGNQMAYGDGDGRTFRAFSAGLDVVAHELTHGVTERSSNLVYQNQSGAMNESVSDIFGAIIEHYVKPESQKVWTMGESIALGNVGLRDFADPRTQQQPAHMSQYVNTTDDNGGVHTNSGIPNNAAYLMTMGGRNPVSSVQVPAGIGYEKAAKVWYRANTQYFTSTTDFAGAARGTQSAARDLQLTQREQDIVECAWIATGVVQGSCKTISPEAPGGTTGGATTGGGGTTGGGTSGQSSTGNTSSGGIDDADGDGVDDSEEVADAGKKKKKKTGANALQMNADVNASCSTGLTPGAGTGGGGLAMGGLVLAAGLGLAVVRRRRSA